MCELKRKLKIQLLFCIIFFFRKNETKKILQNSIIYESLMLESDSKPPNVALTAEGISDVWIRRRIHVNKFGRQDDNLSRVNTTEGRNIDGQIQTILRIYAIQKENRFLNNENNYNTREGYLKESDKIKFEQMIRRSEVFMKNHKKGWVKHLRMLKILKTKLDNAQSRTRAQLVVPEPNRLRICLAPETSITRAFYI